MKKKKTLKAPPLCYRCEWRASAHETDLAPRAECKALAAAISSCYAYRPVIPVKLKPQKGDKRAPCGPAMTSARMVGVGLCEGYYRLIKKNNEYLPYYVPEQIERG